ncbi:MAG: hypothetical protein MI919_36885, partial [Holophagales bacterium]|nr:hypothetical protein [Holophagales bacterium]
MNRLSSRQRLLLIFAALPVVLMVTSLAYMAVMSHVEGEPRTFWQSLEWAGETLTTTGYGADAAWDHPASVLFVVGLQFVGVFLVYTLVPFYMLPLIEERFERRLPSKPPSKLKSHVVILRYGAAVETLIEELLDAEVPVVIAELDEEQTRDLIQARREGNRRYRRVYPIYHKSMATLLGRCRLAHARALVLNGS